MYKNGIKIKNGIKSQNKLFMVIFVTFRNISFEANAIKIKIKNF